MNKGTLGILSLFIICLFFSQIKADCFTTVPTGFTTDDFYLTPTNVTIDACDISNENSCCTVQLSHEIATYSDTWTTGLLTFFGYASTTCKGALQGASCLLCSAEQSNFVRFHSIYAQLYLCSSYCQQIYSSCSSSRKSAGNQIVSDAYAGDYSSFCYDLFESLSDENVQLVLDTTSTDNCWDDLPACTADSYYSQYTECVGGSRSLIYQKKPEADCNGGVSLPPTQTGLPCAQSCPPGQFSSIFGCAMCGLGHYSLGSAIREDSWQSWDSLSVPFTTYCTYLDMYRVEHVLTDVDCGWELDGFQINSGKLNNSQSSYLETSVVLIDAGTLAFDYTVDAEPRYDGLTVYVDREVVLPKVSTQFDYTLQVINLTAGYHFIQFVYSKDQSVSEGADRATLNLVQLTPVNYAADSCSPCRSGRFQNSTGKSYCYDCPANTYSNEGAYRCSKCPPNYYSFEGSSSCTQQLPCTEDDAHYLYDSCYYSGNQLKQNQYPLWNLPHICYDAGNTVPPYPNITSDCVPCNPGEHRSGTQCVYCNNGEASTTGESCESCPSGTAAIKALYLDNFDFWDSGLSTDCAYFCGSPGWDLHNDYIDSGSGHGRYVNSNLYLSATLPVNGFVMFQYELNCTQSCALDFQFTNGTGASFRGGPGSLTSNTYQQKFAVSAGDIEFRWTFTKNDPDGTGRLDNARLYYIAVSNVDDGGAINCTSCKAGTYSASAGQTTCIACPPGTFSEDGASECTPCADGYFNPDSGQSSCIACGEGTDSNSDHTDCLVTCQYEIDGYSYDLTPMARHDNEMYGPIYDFKNQIYYLNLCVREHNNNTCVDIDGEPINTFACQVTVVGYGVDLGDIFGYIPLRNSDFYENGGLTVHLTHGENCRNTQTGEYFPRQTYIDIICDPNAGVGTPVAVDPEDGIIETSKCVYEFSWASLYGCHICTEDDYTYIITACNTQQKRYIQYVWVDNPKTCHGGVSLPDTVELSCVNSDSTYCPPGSYLDLTITVPVCTYVDAGFFSIGGGVVYDDWTDGIPEGFSSVGWVTSQSGGIRSASGDTSLLFIREFVERGTLTFTYRVFGYGDSTGGFTVTINDDVVLPTVLSTDGVFTTYTVSGIDLGHQFIKFEFLGGEYSTGNGGGVGVEVSEIIVIGTAHAAEYQTPCPPGTFSEAGASSCTPCPENTYSDEAADQCTECPGDSYSFIGSSSCNVKEPCTDDDYQLVYTVCNRGNRYGVYETLLPFICDDSNFVPPEMTTIPCDQFDCEPGQYRDQGSSNCQSCDEGFFWDSENSVCAQSSPGYAGILESGWYNQPETSLPSEFNTGCTGDCVAENLGWRSRNDFVDSGSNSLNQVDVFLDLEISLKYDGSVAFDYTVSGDSDNGLFVFVNGKQQIVAYHPSSSTSASIPLLQGENTIRWVYHQESNKEGAVQLKNIVVTGAGASTKQTACPAGTYSNKEGSNTCTPCAAGFYSEDIASTECSKCGPHQFSEVAGSTSCSECGTYTHSNSDNTDCQTECIYYTPDKKIDLTPLADVNGPFSLTSSSTQKLWLNICAKQSSSVLCIDPITGDSIDTYSCLVDSTGSGVDAGRLLSVSVDDKTKSVQMIFQNGQIGKGCTEPTTTNILMICDPDNDNSSPVEVDGSTICALRFEWHSAYACYVCNVTEDYETRKTDCEDKKLTTADIRISDCYGPKVMNSNEEECTVPFHVPILLIVVVVTVIVLLIAVVVVIVIWNMKLQKQYSALVQKSSGSYEMSEVPESAMPDDE